MSKLENRVVQFFLREVSSNIHWISVICAATVENNEVLIVGKFGVIFNPHSGNFSVKV